MKYQDIEDTLRIWFPSEAVSPLIYYREWNIHEHIPYQKTFLWKPSHTSFYTSSKQGKYSAINGYELLHEIKDKNPFNVNVLYHLFHEQRLIPEEWKYKDGRPQSIFFWGTVFMHEGRHFVLYLYWAGACWLWSVAWLDGIWMANDPALIQTQLTEWKI